LTRARPDGLRGQTWDLSVDRELYRALRAQEEALGYVTPDGRYDVAGKGMDIARLDAIDLAWRALFEG
jgi:hypothetical protein